jgi:YjjG family noncanonical pyrimidine nucleotidase
MSLFDAIFIDADNTLFDFDRAQENALAESLTQFSLPGDKHSLATYEEINADCWGKYHRGEIENHQINEMRWSVWLKTVGEYGRVDATELAEHFAESLAQQCEKEEGAEDLIQTLSNQLPIHVITNGFPTSQAHRWRKAGWESQIHGITVSAVVGVQKPEAKIFEIAMKAVGVADASRCLMIGDNIEADVFGPQNVGMKGCWYQRGDMTNTTSVVPDYTVTNLKGVIDIVNSAE